MSRSSRVLRRWLIAMLALGAAGVALIAFAALGAREAPEHPYFDESGPLPWVMAHRGGAALWPENTLHAFRGAADLGVDVLEGDVRATADGVLVLLHDSTVDRTTDGAGAVAAMTLAELKWLDAAHTWTPDDGGTYPLRGRGITVPTVGELLEAHPTGRLNLELKPEDPSLAEPLCADIRRHAASERVLVSSFHEGVLRAFRRACPEVAISASTRETRLFYVLTRLRLASAHSPRAHAIQAPPRSGRYEVLTPGFVRAAGERYRHVHAWTINDPAELRRFVELRVDGIITDRPDVLLEILGRR
jgi:glycerophosphoryl diester phosphodiesterase